MNFNRAPFLDKSNEYFPVVSQLLEAVTDFLSSAGCMRIQPTPLLLQSILMKAGLVVSNLARTGEEVIHTLKSENNLTSSDVQALGGIGLR